MADTSRDHQLGMDRIISRRDFLNGVALTIGGAALGSAGHGHAAFAAAPAGDPAALTGLRGHSDAAMEVMHAIRDGSFWDTAPAPEATGESYDLIVVGGGISGLAAAFLYRQQVPGAKILIVENNDDFGGQATRNTFTASNGKTVIGYGGSQSLQSPSFFSPLVHQVLADVGIDVTRFETYYDTGWHDRLGLEDAHFFAAEVYGRDALVVTSEVAADWVPNTPLNETARVQLIELIDSPLDPLAGKSRAEKFETLSAISYSRFLTELCGYDAQLAAFFQHSTDEYFGASIDAVSAADAWANGNPGFGAMDLGDVPDKTNSPSGRLLVADPDAYIYHFPDGNGGVARALLRALIPNALPGSTMEDLVTEPVGYNRLDLADNPVRLRLNASAVKVAHDGPIDAATSVTVTYFEAGKLRTATAGNVVLACWHRVIPYLTDEIGEAQLEALNDQVKTPLLYANVLIRNFEAFSALGIGGFLNSAGPWAACFIDDPVSMGTYQCAQSPADPVLLHLFSFPTRGDGSAPREQSSAGRAMLTEITFADMERDIRDMLGQALKDGGFDAARDIEAITVNRWSHGYALEYLRPWDAYWPDGPLPIVTARKPWGRIAIANSDSGAYAYAHCAIDQAARAVSELLGDKAQMPAFTDFPGPPPDMVGLD